MRYRTPCRTVLTASPKCAIDHAPDRSSGSPAQITLRAAARQAAHGDAPPRPTCQPQDMAGRRRPATTATPAPTSGEHRSHAIGKQQSARIPAANRSRRQRSKGPTAITHQHHRHEKQPDRHRIEDRAAPPTPSVRMLRRRPADTACRSGQCPRIDGQHARCSNDQRAFATGDGFEQRSPCGDSAGAQREQDQCALPMLDGEQHQDERCRAGDRPQRRERWSGCPSGPGTCRSSTSKRRPPPA